MHAETNCFTLPAHDASVNVLQYKDKARQKQYAKQLQRKQQLAEQMRAAKQVPSQKMQKRLPAAKRRASELHQDEADFAKECRLLKKLQRGKITQEEFDEQMEAI